MKLTDQLLAPFEEQLAELNDRAGGPPPPCREVYAAVHVVLKKARTPAAGIVESIDWPTTFKLRQRLAAYGFGIAEAMDTAQRYELGWDAAWKLIEGTGRLNLPHGFVAGASADHLSSCKDPVELATAWAWQARQISAAGGTAILLPQPALTKWKCTEELFIQVYLSVLEQVDQPVILHWLGEMFHPAMRGYFPGESFARLMELGQEQIRGAKLSLLDANLERQIRTSAIGRGQRIFTGDDFHFAELIAGDDDGSYSHALLGIFDAIARPASLALRFLAHGNRKEYDQIMAPCEKLGQAIFAAPTQHYKCGLAWLAWLNGWQDNRRLIDGVEGKRDQEHLLQITELANLAGCFENADLAQQRLQEFLRTKA